ncbi:MAG TPA: CPBP family glutamic-type intramembrane protease, partial [Caldilinea sp.]|nr:CPBP family glutamic-type intramembrane protease [Caldilinea sp.]
VLRRWRMTHLALWIANIIAALAFAAGHLPTVLVLYGASSPAELPGLLVAEIFVLNAIVSLAAGWRYMTSGLVAAIGIHFWADIVWHVIWPLV